MLTNNEPAPRERLKLIARHDPKLQFPFACRRCGVVSGYGHLVDCVPGRRVINHELSEVIRALEVLRRRAFDFYDANYTRIKAADEIRRSLGWK